MSLYNINDVELDIDMEDYEFQKKYEEAFEKVEEEEKLLQKIGKNSEITKGYCEIFYHLFDNLFGEGTGKALFKGKYNIRLVDETYTEFIEICSKQAKESRERRYAAINKFKPKSNKYRRVK